MLAYGAAAKAGVLAALPGTLAELAGRCAVDEDALRAVLGQLVAWDMITLDSRGRYATGPRSPVPPHDAMLQVHAATIQRWAALVDRRLVDRRAGAGEFPARPAPTGAGLDLLAINARRITRPLVDACLARFPHARRVLDLGGGHGEHALEFTRRGLRATMQDLPPAITAAQQRGHLTGAGVELVTGDFFATLAPGPFDLVLIAATTNMFDGPSNRDLYRRLRAVIAPDGGVAIASYMRGRDEVTASFGLQMLAWTDSGDAHSADDYRSWLADAGYGPLQTHEVEDPPQTLVLAAR